jgi:TonB family protein
MRAPFSSACLALVLAGVVSGSPARAQDNDIAAARDLYASAAYDDALAVLNRLHASDRPPAEAKVIEQYRAFCLLALGRGGDAEKAIEAVVTAEPSYHPSDTDVSPRIRNAFADVRRRMLPVIIQQKYAQAKSAYERKEWAAAAAGFSQVLVTIADPDLVADAARPPLSDIRTLASGFEELSAKAAAPPPPPPAPVVQAPPPPQPVVAAPPAIYTAEDRTVVPPAPITQTLPSFRGVSPIERVGRIEVIVDEAGTVESAVMTTSVSPAYDKAALAAARNWRYSPATVNGKPVKFRKIVQITVKPTS